MDAEKASQDARATQSDEAEPLSTISIRFGDHIFHLAGREIDKSKLKATPIAELPEDQYQGALEALERWRNSLAYKSENMTFPEMPDTSKYAAYQDYATITIGGRVIGKTDNQGGITTYDNALGEAVSQAWGRDRSEGGQQGYHLWASPGAISSGLDREHIRRQGDETSALTQAQYDAAPKLNPEDYRPRVNVEALENDPEYIRLQQQIQDLKTSRAAYLAQQQGQISAA